MRQSYTDILDKLGEPIWWDEAGVPRYCEFHPSRVNDAYADKAALLLVICQSCCKKFIVATSGDKFLEDPSHLFSYGDPPNIACCLPGPTESTFALKILKYFKRNATGWICTMEEEIHPDVFVEDLHEHLSES